MLTPVVAPSRPQLRVIATDSPMQTWVPAPGLTSLAAHAFRPGEIPTLVTVQLDAETRPMVMAAAAQDHLPWQVWLRVGVEAARGVGDLAVGLGLSARATVELLDECAGDVPSVRDDVIPLVAAPLKGYADLLERGELSSRVPRGTGEIFVSDEMHGAWCAAAAANKQTLQEWVNSMIFVVPASCVRWEIAAARESKTLAEWLYASALSAAASSIA